MLSVLVIVATGAYLLLIAFLRAGLNRASRIVPRDDFEPSVSVIVAARNEEQYISACIQSLLKLEYPKEKLEIVIVNDGSRDRTLEIAESFTPDNSILRVVSTTPGEGNLRGKTNAVAQGIESSSGEILMFTDADCIVQPTWVRETTKLFQPEVGIVGGFTLLDVDRTFEGVQALDWIFLFGLASATAGWKIPLTAIGTNLSVRRSAYDATGGYQDIPFSVTEDYSLVRAILVRTKFTLRFPIHRATVVRSKACQSWSQLYRQKQRWGVGGLDMILPGVLIMVIGWLVRFFLITGAVVNPSLTVAALALAVMGGDYFYLSRILKPLGGRPHLKVFLPFQVYFSIYVLVLPFIAVMSRRIVWKERSL